MLMEKCQIIFGDSIKYKKVLLNKEGGFFMKKKYDQWVPPEGSSISYKLVEPKKTVVERQAHRETYV